MNRKINNHLEIATTSDLDPALKKVRGYDNIFVSDNGFVYKIVNNVCRLLPPSLSSAGYHMVAIWENGKQDCVLVHRLVAKAFCPNPHNRREVDHINSCKSDNAASNLRWVTHKQNMRLGWTTGRFKKVSKSIKKSWKKRTYGVCVLLPDDVKEIRRLAADGLTNKQLSFIYNVSANHISRIRNYRSFKSIE